MQWLIDTILDLLKPTSGYQHRPCPAEPDFQIAALAATTDWTVRDCSSFVPVGTKSILLRTHAEASASTRYILLRRPGDTQWYNYVYVGLITANQPHRSDVIVSLDENRCFESKVNSTVWTALILNIAAYWMPTQQYHSFVNRGDPSSDDFDESAFPADQSWEPLDLTGIIPPNTKAVLFTCRVWSSSSQRSLRFRTHGNTHAYNTSQCTAVQSGLNYHYDITVPTNGLQKIDYWSSLGVSPVVRLTVKGWWF